MPEEAFDVCDEQDRVIGRALRSEVHARGLLHRAVHIWVNRSDGALLIHRRSAAKDEFPLRYTSSASGHVDAGESYDAAAVRELREELGVELPLTYVTKIRGGPETANEHTVLYRGLSDGPFSPDPHEIECIEWRTVDEITKGIVFHPDDFTPPFRVLFAWFLRSAV